MAGWERRSAKLRSMDAYGQKRIAFYCPGCKEHHIINIEAPIGRPTWTFNGNWDAPTFSPSVRHFTTDPDTGVEETYCHYFIVDGRFNYCGDCNHDFNGRQGVEMPDYPYIG